MVVGAQLATALQWIVEEKYMARYHTPALLAVGLEGFWGLVLCIAALPLLTGIKGSDGLPLDDFPQALRVPHTTWHFHAVHRAASALEKLSDSCLGQS